MTKDKNKKLTTVVKSGGTFSGTAKHQRTAMVSMTSKTTKQKGTYAPRRQLDRPALGKSKYDKDDDDGHVCCMSRPGRSCGKVVEKMVKATLSAQMCDVSKCCQCGERKCPDCEWSVQCPTCDEHGFCPDCEDNAEPCEWCGSCVECRPDGDYCCKSYNMYANQDSTDSSDSDDSDRW